MALTANINIVQYEVTNFCYFACLETNRHHEKISKQIKYVSCIFSYIYFMERYIMTRCGQFSTNPRDMALFKKVPQALFQENFTQKEGSAISKESCSYMTLKFKYRIAIHSKDVKPKAVIHMTKACSASTSWN